MKKFLPALLITSLLLAHVAYATSQNLGEWFYFSMTVEEAAETDPVEQGDNTYEQGNLKDETEQAVIFKDFREGIGYRDKYGVQKKGGWFWIDKYGDNTMQCYYFDKYGFLVTDDEIDGHRVNDEGQRIKNNSENDEIELKEFTLAGPGAADPFALQLYDEQIFGENSQSSAGELFSHVYATTSVAYREATVSNANKVTVDELDKDGNPVVKADDEDTNVTSNGSIIAGGMGVGGPVPMQGADTITQNGSIIAGDNSVIKY